MTPAVASERSIFFKNHDWNSYNYRVFRVAVNNAPIFRGVGARGGRKLYTNRHIHTRGTATVTIIIKIIRSAAANRYNTTYSVYVCKTAQHEAHALFWNNN